MGTGSGYLTLEISKKAKFVSSYEIDYDLYVKAMKLCKYANNIRIINSDFFRNSVTEFDLFISNIPYQYSNRIIKWLIGKKFRSAVIMVQHEFANKLMAQPNNRSYSAISVIAQFCFDIESLFVVESYSFVPVPRVESQVIKLTPKNKITSKVMNIVELLFRNKNRAIDLKNNKFGKLTRISELCVEEIIEIAIRKSSFNNILDS